MSASNHPPIPSINGGIESPIPVVNDSSEFRIGVLLIEMGKISVSDAQRIVKLHEEKGLRFGDAAKQLGLITEADIQEVLSKQFNYPYVIHESRFSEELFAAYKPYSTQVELLRGIRSQLKLGWFKEKHKSLAISSIDEGTGNSRFAANLALVFSQLGEKTLLIDANLRKPKQHDIFNLKNTYGLSDILIGRAGLEAIVDIAPYDMLSVLPAGTIPPNPQEMVSGTLFKELILFFRSIYDVVLIDTPAHSMAADAINISAAAEGAVLIALKHKTRASKMTEVATSLENYGIHIVGSLMIDY